MERDKKGRFIKKGKNGLQTNSDINSEYVIEPIEEQNNSDESNPNASRPEILISGLGARNYNLNSLNPNFISNKFFPEKKYYTIDKNGKFVDQFGRPINPFILGNNPDAFEFVNTAIIKDESGDEGGEDSAGRKTFLESNKNKNFLNKLDLANFLEYIRAGIGISNNNKITDRALKAEKPFLQDISESHHSVYGDYRAQVEGEKAAAQLRNLASKPLTSDGALLQQMMLDAQIKGQNFINQGNAQDEASIKQTNEIAWEQEKENLQYRHAVSMQNRQAMLMTEKNKANLENIRDSANISQNIAPLLAAKEKRLRNEAVKQKYYQEQYNNALITKQVWNDKTNLSPDEIILLNKYLIGGENALSEYIGEDTRKQQLWNQLQLKKQNEILNKLAELKGVYTNNDVYNPYPLWEKKGGTIYKARLVKRTKDNDRTAKSIESNKKIAARFLEKALDSLYTYKDVELIAVSKNKKRKYLAGGGLPVVGFTPVFSTDESSDPRQTSEKETEDLTTKDVLSLLKDMDGLPSDMKLIINSLQNFKMKDFNDPLGLTASSNIESQYISLISKIKLAKFHQESYTSALNHLKTNGGLNEYAITSDGLLIGTNSEGDFKYFSINDVFDEKFKDTNYQLLTNSNLLYLRANSTDAAFNHLLIHVAQGGISIESVDKYIKDIINNLGTNLNSQEGYISSTKGDVIEGLNSFLEAIKKSDGLFNETINDLYKYKYLTKSQADQAKNAILYIYNTLPNNAKTLLKLKSDGTDHGALELIESLISSKISDTSQFDVDLKGGPSHKSTSSEKDDTKLKSSLPLNVLKNIGGIDSYVDIDKGNGIHMSIRGTQFNQVKTPNGEPISDTSLATMLQNSGLQSIVKDMRSIQFGDQKVSPEALSFITYNNTGITRANLPIKPDGSVNLDLLELYEKAERDIELSEDKSLENIKSIYEQYGIASLLNADGTYNQSKFAPFIITEGYTTDALSGIQTSEFVKEYQGNSDAAVALMQKSLAVGTGKNIVTPEVDEFSWYNPADWFGWTDTIFKGVIYIPITNNVNTAVYGANQHIDYDEALLQEEKYLNFEKMSDLRSTSADLLNI